MRVSQMDKTGLHIGDVILMEDQIGVVIGNELWVPKKSKEDVVSKTLFCFKLTSENLITSMSSIDVPDYAREFCVVQNARASIQADIGSSVRKFNNTIHRMQGLFVVDSKLLLVSDSHQTTTVSGSSIGTERKYVGWNLESMQASLLDGNTSPFQVANWSLRLERTEGSQEARKESKSWRWKSSDYDSSMNWVG